MFVCVCVCVCLCVCVCVFVCVCLVILWIKKYSEVQVSLIYPVGISFSTFFVSYFSISLDCKNEVDSYNFLQCHSTKHGCNVTQTAPGLNFINVLRTAFTLVAPKIIRIQSNPQYLFTLLGSTCAKAVSRMLMKLTPGS